MSLSRRNDAQRQLNDTNTILVAEDDLELADLLCARLRREGWDVAHVSDGLAAVEHIHAHAPDLVLLDVMMPGIDGREVCRRVRGAYSGWIVMLTALDDDTDQIVGLELGADAYLVKPVAPRVLVARVRALLRRGAARESRAIRLGAIEIDAARRRVLRGGDEVALTTTEFDLLWLLASAAGTVVDRARIYEDVFGSAYDGIDRAADVYVSRLRAKLGDDPKSPTLLKTVRGVGYLLAPP